MRLETMWYRWLRFSLLLPLGNIQVDALPSARLAHSPRASKSWFTVVADRVIEAVWPPLRVEEKHGATSPNPPTHHLVRYGGDVVLRFNTTQHEETEALAEAVRILLLDVWDSNSDWVDIRVSKDAVCLHSMTVLSL